MPRMSIHPLAAPFVAAASFSPPKPVERVWFDSTMVPSASTRDPSPKSIEPAANPLRQ